MNAEILYVDLLSANMKCQMLHQLFWKLSGYILLKKHHKSAFHLLHDGPSNLHFTIPGKLNYSFFTNIKLVKFSQRKVKLEPTELSSI